MSRRARGNTRCGATPRRRRAPAERTEAEPGTSTSRRMRCERTCWPSPDAIDCTEVELTIKNTSSDEPGHVGIFDLDEARGLVGLLERQIDYADRGGRG